MARKRPMTTEELFNRIDGILKEKCKLPDILDYGLATHRPVSITNYEYDLKNNLDYGGNEGIYLDLWIEYTAEGKKCASGLGTFKTLRTDDKAMHIMAALLADFIIEEYHQRTIDTRKTLTLDQVMVLLEASRDTPIHMQVLFNVLMGLRRSEINGLKYSDIDYINRTVTVQRQLGKKPGSRKEDFAPKTFTKQEVRLKTDSSYRVLPIPDYVFEAVLEHRKWYERMRSRRRKEFKDWDYICCSSYGRPRSKSFHWKHYKKLLADNGLPDIRWHDLRSTFCTMLLKNEFNPKAVSKLMGHAGEIITMDVYGDKQEIIADCVPEIAGFMEDVLPDQEAEDKFREELLEIVVDTREYLGAAS